MSGAKFSVKMTAGAIDDLRDIHKYLQTERDATAAAMLLETLLDRIETLEAFPLRGNIPKELEGLGIHDFRQVLLKPYRIVYRVIEHTVYISLIADGRRDMQTLLERRLLSER